MCLHALIFSVSKYLFPEHKKIKREDLGITKSLHHFPQIDFWKQELGLKDIANINLLNLLNNKEQTENDKLSLKTQSGPFRAI